MEFAHMCENCGSMEYVTGPQLNAGYACDNCGAEVQHDVEREAPE